MDRDEGVRDNDVPGCSGFGKGGDAFIDRSRVRILLCDNNLKSCDEVFVLLCKCSYQVTSVQSARQVVDVLNAEGPDIDIILSEVDLPMAKGMKMLKYIMRDKDLRRIPVIMMSAQDEVSIVVKCLRLGAADYLVKPLRTNELLNLWTHMWRRRRMLGLAEKDIMNYEFDLVASDPSDANTNSTTLFSDDTDDKSHKSTNPEMGVPDQHEDEPNASVATAMAFHAPLEPPPMHPPDYRPDVPGISDHRTGQIASCPKKSELRIGESSAFFTYVKSSISKSRTQVIFQDFEIAKTDSSTQDRLNTWAGQIASDTQECENIESRENQTLGDNFLTSSSIPDSLSKDISSTLPVTTNFPEQSISRMEIYSQVQFNPRNKSHPEVSNSHSLNAFPYYISGLTNQVMMPQYPQLTQFPAHVPNMPSLPYYPMGLCPQPGQILSPHQPWPSYESSSIATEPKLSKVDRREAALMKFRQKRKERCFDKKIRYVNRKRLAERRPRVRGQFVRKMNGINVDLNGTTGSADLDDDEEEDEEVHAGMESSPENEA